MFVFACSRVRGFVFTVCLRCGLVHEVQSDTCPVCVYAVFTRWICLCFRSVNAVFTECSRKPKFACLCLPAWLLSVHVFVFTLCLRVFGAVFVFACLR